MKITLALGIFATALISIAHAQASNSVNCIGLQILETETVSNPGSTTFIRIQIRFTDAGVVDFFKGQGFNLPTDPSNGFPGTLTVTTNQYEAGHNAPYSYRFNDETYGANADWSVSRDGNGEKVVVTNPYNGNSSNWYFNNCSFN
jgi:hypothetical protein